MLFYCKSGLTLEQTAQRGCGAFTLGDIQNPSAQDSGQVALGNPALNRRVELDDLYLQRSLPTSNTPQFYDSDDIMCYRTRLDLMWGGRRTLPTPLLQPLSGQLNFVVTLTKLLGLQTTFHAIFKNFFVLFSTRQSKMHIQ